MLDNERYYQNPLATIEPWLWILASGFLVFHTVLWLAFQGDPNSVYLWFGLSTLFTACLARGTAIHIRQLSGKLLDLERRVREAERKRKEEGDKKKEEEGTS